MNTQTYRETYRETRSARFDFARAMVLISKISGPPDPFSVRLVRPTPKARSLSTRLGSPFFSATFCLWSMDQHTVNNYIYYSRYQATHHSRVRRDDDGVCQVPVSESGQEAARLQSE
jgi:hypothetical protein